MSLKRTIMVTVLSIAILFSTAMQNNVIASTIYEKVDTEILSSGVTHKHILRFNKEGWLNMNVLYVNMRAKAIDIDLLYSKNGLATKETLSSMIKGEENVIAAINGDFFYLTTPDSPLGVMIKDGEMISSPVIVENFASFMMDRNGSGFVHYFQAQMYASTSKGVVIPVTSVNKYTWEYRQIMLIDQNWGSKSPGANAERQDMVEVVVVNDYVVEVRKGKPSVEIPNNGYILLANGENGQLLYENLNEGDKITIHIQSEPNIENIKLALGGGTILVKEGKVVPFTQNVSGAHPRTAIGVTQDSKTIVFVTVDGRHSSYRGVDGTQLANLLIELGCYEAILMDGGGSTTMLARELGNLEPKVINSPSDGSERRIINGIAVVSKLSPATLLGIKAETNDTKAFVGASREIVIKAFDENFNPLPVDMSKVNFSLKKGKGIFDGNKFIPHVSGEAIVVAEYLGKRTEVKIDVLEEIIALEATYENLRLNHGQIIALNVKGVDKKGFRAYIDPKDIQWKDIEGLGTFEEGLYIAGQKSGATVLEGTFDNKKVVIKAVIGHHKVLLENFEEMRVHFTSYPQNVEGDLFMDRNAINGSYAIRLEYDFTKTDETRAAYINFGEDGILVPDFPERIGMWVHVFEPATHWIRGRIRDNEGEIHVIDFTKSIDWIGWKYLSAQIPTNVAYPIRLERIYVAEVNAEQKKKGRLLFDNVEALYQIDLPIVEERDHFILLDSVNRPPQNEGKKLFIHNAVEYNDYTLLDKIIGNKITSTINSRYDYCIFTGDVDITILNDLEKPHITASPGYSSTVFEDNLIIQLDNRANGLRATDYNQWPWLINLLESNTKENIFVVLPKPIWGKDGFSDLLEANLFAEILSQQAEKGRKVFVVHGGETVKGDLIDGVRYISTGYYPSSIELDPTEAYKYIEFNIYGDEVTYQIKSLFE